MYNRPHNGLNSQLMHWVYYGLNTSDKGQIPLRYTAREPSRELVCDLLARLIA